MPHTAVVGNIEIPATWSKDEAVGLLQESGLVGAGGAGYPTYLKYEHAPPTLVVNAAESEPGYYANKLLLRDEPEAYVDTFSWLRETFSIDRIIVAAEEVARPYARELQAYADRLGTFEVRYIPNKYALGQEKALCRELFGISFAKDELPHHKGIVVSNNETIFNMYRAAYQEHPTTTKFLQIYGEIGLPRVFEVPVGALAIDLVRAYGADPRSLHHHRLYDGGPVLADLVADPFGAEPFYPVTKTTNGLLFVDPRRDRARRRHYPEPGFTNNSADVAWAPTKIENLEDRIRRVHVPRQGTFWTSGHPTVREGDAVHVGDELTQPDPDGPSVAIHASIPGTVSRILSTRIEIDR